MARLAILIVGFGLLAQVSTTFIGFSHGSEPTQLETSHEWTEGSHHQESEHEEKVEIKKKWSWLPSWPWKKHKEEEHHVVHEEHESSHHYPIWKIHKYKGIEVRPIKVVEEQHYNHNYHPEVIHHYEPHHDDEIKKEVLSSFAGEGHTMDTLHKYWPALHKDKKFLEKFKKFQVSKTPSWGYPEEHHNQNWPQHEDLHGYGSENHAAVVSAIPDVPDVNLPGLHHLPIPELPYVEDKPVFDSYGNIVSHGHEESAAPGQEHHPIQLKAANQPDSNTP